MDTTQAYKSNTTLNSTPKDFTLQSVSELRIFQGTKRTQFESSLRLNPLNGNQWLQYAQFEVAQHDTRRARSVMERALTHISHIGGSGVGGTGNAIKLWMFYIQMEIKQGYISHARNLLLRVTKLMPKVSKFWFVWLSLEEKLVGSGSCVEIYERWLAVDQSEYVYNNYIDLLLRLGGGNMSDIRLVCERMVKKWPATGWQRWIDLECNSSDDTDIHHLFNLAVLSLHKTANLSLEFFKQWVDWELKHGDGNQIGKILEFGEQIFGNEFVTYKFKVQRLLGLNTNTNPLSLIKLQLETDPYDYTLWWDYAQINPELSLLANMPTPEGDRASWLQYVYTYIFILYHSEVSEEISFDSLKEEYERLITRVKTSGFTFNIIWTSYGDMLLRNEQLSAMRQFYGQLIGQIPSVELIEHYISVEQGLGNKTRTRMLYQKMIELWPANVSNWCEYIHWEIKWGSKSDVSPLIESLIHNEGFDFPMKRQLLNDLEEAFDKAFILDLWRYLADKGNNVTDIIQLCLLAVKFDKQPNSIRKLFKTYLLKLEYADKIKLLNTWKNVESQLWEDENGLADVEALMDDLTNVEFDNISDSDNQEEEGNSGEPDIDNFDNSKDVNSDTNGEYLASATTNNLSSRFASDSEDE